MMKSRLSCLLSRVQVTGPAINSQRLIIHTSPFKRGLILHNSPFNRGIHTPNDGFERQGAYEGHGKTTINILNMEMAGMNLIDSFSTAGFRLNDNSVIIGPAIIFPTAVLRWCITSAAQITEESLALFTMLDPKPDLIVIGHGEDYNIRNPVDVKVILSLKKKGIPLEILSTEKAVSTYNYLLEEGRVVAAALIPPRYISPNPISTATRKIAQGDIFTTDTNPFYMNRADTRRHLRHTLEEKRKLDKLLEKGEEDGSTNWNPTGKK